MPFQKVLVAFDGSELSVKALQKAVAITQEDSAELIVIHVYQSPVLAYGSAFVTVPANLDQDYEEFARSVLKEAEEVTAGVSGVKHVLQQGQPAVTILEYAEENGVDLIIMGSRGLSGIREFVLGSVSHNVVQHSKVPVLVIK
ncbi:universal stress protein [Paenibacillus elgii]|uniref:Universal stress protein n=1 Tax=Paenibacillus elgii TaxID=189691 RepID=A0A163UIS3_9BACL|nr:universal stress protein [Paenibacillus elgii]KZE73380.1 universal stress protein UspA [Paenibacillus elgii]NEN82639.1 universal stress protein [Paenibacillus elgii]PUA39815.1 universal stress protein [Paenibacillus elgii]